MRVLKIYILAVLCALLTGCEREENPGNYNAGEVKLFARMGVHLSVEGGTKSIVTGAVTNNSNKELSIGVARIDEKIHKSYPYFRVEDATTPLSLTAELGLPQPEEGNLRIISGFKNNSGNDAPQFFVNSTDEIRYAAWYPATGTYAGTYNSTEEKTTVTFRIPDSGDSDIMYSEPVSGSMGSGFGVMQFNHALSMFRIYAYKSTTSFNWGNIKSLELTEMPNQCTITLPMGAENTECSIVYSGKDTLSYSCDSPVKDGFDNKELLKEWIAAAPQVDGLGLLDITVTTEGGSTGTTGEHELSIARDFKPGYAYDIILRFSDKGVINADVQIADWTDGGDVNSDINISSTFYDLSTTGTANCYIVSSANFGYCFNATVKGNGNSAAIGGGIDAVLAPKTVEIIWSEVAEFRLETNKIVEGKVLFNVDGNTTTDRITGKIDRSDKSLKSEGNVLLGVYDAQGKCIWTWHIWITDKPQKQNYTKGYVALDRNLGATAAAPGGIGTMNGLFYQWGRPTPFRIKQDGKISAEDSQTRVTPDEAVANPGIFYGSMDDNVHDWVDRRAFQNINNLWGYREVEHVQPIKTLYDPCPVGYHVPYQRNWESMEQFWADMSGYNTAKANGTVATFWKELQGIRFVIEGNDIWYPFQGYININGEYKLGHIHKDGTGNYGHSEIPIVEMWPSLINRHDADDANLPAETDERINDSPYRLQFTRDYLAKLSEDGEYTNRTRGLGVRCVSDNTADVVKDLSASQTANCYMVHEDGFYKFKTTIRGNGVGSLLPLGGTTTAEINGGLSTTISPARVDILWWQGDFTNGETDFPAEKDLSNHQNQPAPSNMCITLLDEGIISSDGYVAFKVSNFSKGNTILAAYDDAGNILWTWHIWLTDKPADKISGNYTKMDRFLGATYAPDIPANISQITWPEGGKDATMGFYYQWGRKDPIMGPPTLGYGTDGSPGSTVASSGWWKKNNDGTWSYRLTIDVKGAASIPDVVKDPTAFYKSTTANGQKNSQWFPESFADGYTNVALWGYAVADYSIQGQTFSKTMHDPCPPGYRTPFHFSWRYNSSEKYAEGDNTESANGTQLTDAETGFDSQGIVTNKAHFEKMWFPLVGYRNPTTGACTNVGYEGRMNTGMPMGQYDTRSFWYDGSKTLQRQGGDASAYGKMVRCMKE